MPGIAVQNPDPWIIEALQNETPRWLAVRDIAEAMSRRIGFTVDVRPLYSNLRYLQSNRVLESSIRHRWVCNHWKAVITYRLRSRR